MKVNLNQHHHPRLLMVIDRVTANGVMLAIHVMYPGSLCRNMASAYVHRSWIQVAYAANASSLSQVSSNVLVTKCLKPLLVVTR